MRKLFVTALMAAAALPALAPSAMAQSSRELQRDRRDIREEQQDVRQAQRNGTYHDVRQQQNELADARREYHEDLRDSRDRNWRDNDCQNWRQHNRNEFRRGNWNAPFRYSSFSAGRRIGSAYYAPRYVVSDPWRYHLPRPAVNQRWVRHYNDLLLVNVRNGVVVRVLRNFYW